MKELSIKHPVGVLRKKQSERIARQNFRIADPSRTRLSFLWVSCGSHLLKHLNALSKFGNGNRQSTGMIVA
jgi:hypothetical protein